MGAMHPALAVAGRAPYAPLILVPNAAAVPEPPLTLDGCIAQLREKVPRRRVCPAFRFIEAYSNQAESFDEIAAFTRGILDELEEGNEHPRSKHAQLVRDLEAHLRGEGEYLFFKHGISYKGEHKTGEMDLLGVRRAGHQLSFSYFEAKPSTQYRDDAAKQIDRWRRFMQEDVGVSPFRVHGYLAYPGKDGAPRIESIPFLGISGPQGQNSGLGDYYGVHKAGV